MTTWPGGIAALTLFVEDLAACRTFYQEVFGQAAVFEDPHSAVFRFGETLVNLLQVDNAAELVEPATAASPEAGNRFVLTLEVDDVDAMCESLGARGVTLLNGPMDRPWVLAPRASATRADTSGSSRTETADRESGQGARAPILGSWRGSDSPAGSRRARAPCRRSCASWVPS